MWTDKDIAKMYWQGYTINYLVGFVRRDFKSKTDARAYIERIIYHEVTGKRVS